MATALEHGHVQSLKVLSKNLSFNLEGCAESVCPGSIIL